jgi:predicted nuclease with RNAse H fold
MPDRPVAKNGPELVSGGSSHDPRHVIGIDVQISRGLAVAVMDRKGVVIESLWRSADAPEAVIAELSGRYAPAAFAVDAPRCPLPSPRIHYWDGDRWRARRKADRGFGRHCEVVISACGLARPQWTPIGPGAPDWMICGFRLFTACVQQGLAVEEVFPSAAYTQLAGDAEARVEMPLNGFAQGPKDMLDAVLAAYSLHEFTRGCGAECGNGDGLGRIVLPRPVEHPVFAAVQGWPGRPVV